MFRINNVWLVSLSDDAGQENAGRVRCLLREVRHALKVEASFRMLLCRGRAGSHLLIWLPSDTQPGIAAAPFASDPGTRILHDRDVEISIIGPVA